MFSMQKFKACQSTQVVVKPTSMQLVGESIAAISVPLDAISKLENMDFCGKRLSESAVKVI